MVRVVRKAMPIVLVFVMLNSIVMTSYADEQD